MLLIVVMLAFSLAIFAQDKIVFAGIQPGITKEKFYDEDEFDINVFPLVLETPLVNNLDVRLVTLANYHFGGKQQFSDLGVNVILPYYFTTDKEKSPFPYGIYLGPMIGLSRNNLNDHNTVNLAAEAGYMFKADNRFTLSLSMQYGRTYFDYDHSDPIWREHFALVKVNLGFWLNR